MIHEIVMRFLFHLCIHLLIFFLMIINFESMLQYDLPFVEVHRAREFTFKASTNSENDLDPANINEGCSVWNCDGEVIENPNVKIRYHHRGITLNNSQKNCNVWKNNIILQCSRVHCQLVKVFTRRLQDTLDEPGCFCSTWLEKHGQKFGKNFTCLYSNWKNVATGYFFIRQNEKKF